MSAPDYSGASMHDLFRMEAESHTAALTTGLLVLERNPTAKDQLESCMRAAHSLKGAARIVGIDVGVKIAHAMEDCFVAAQAGRIALEQQQIDILLRGVDLLRRVALDAERSTDGGRMLDEEAKGFVDQLAAGPQPTAPMIRAPAPVEPAPVATPVALEAEDRSLRVTAENLDRLLGLAGESRIESRRLKPFTQNLLRQTRAQYDLCTKLDELRDRLGAQAIDEQTLTVLEDARRRAYDSHEHLAQRLEELESVERHQTALTHELYDAALACRMRPFADGTDGMARMVRDLARTLGKQAQLDVIGSETRVDRDVLERLKAPLGHLLRNAVDHAIESPADRVAAGKNPIGRIRLEARHSAGMLQVSVADDGRGVPLETLRATIVARNLGSAETVASLSEAELLEFLFLPAFSLRSSVTEISGRGVGLDVLREMLRQVRGSVRVITHEGQGTQFSLQLPLTLSVMRALLVEIAGEPYALPLASIGRTLRAARATVTSIEGFPQIEHEGQAVGLVGARNLLRADPAGLTGDELHIVLLGSREKSYGLVVDRFLGERELVVHPLDPRLGKIKDIAAGALMEDGSPVLIMDVEDMLRSVEKLAAQGTLMNRAQAAAEVSSALRKRVLIVEDSLTVRELERKLLANHGYEVEVATDGMDGWNAVRSSSFDLVLTDIDMPRMDGIELITLMKKDPRVSTIPVMIVSYKDRPEDRQRGLEAGADYYLAKGGFHDTTMLQAVIDLIGEARPS